MSVGQVWRFLTIGAINTLFGYALYALMIAIGLQLFLAQATATIIAILFNYFSYSCCVFEDVRPSRIRFLLSYGLNYLIGFAALAACATFVPSPYLAGLLATVLAAASNFIVLRRWVFAPRVAKARVERGRMPRSANIGAAIDHVPCG